MVANFRAYDDALIKIWYRRLWCSHIVINNLSLKLMIKLNLLCHIKMYPVYLSTFIAFDSVLI